MLTIKIYLQISVYYVYPVNPFQADVTFLYSLRKPEIFILDVFRAYRNGTSAWNGLREQLAVILAELSFYKGKSHRIIL